MKKSTLGLLAVTLLASSCTWVKPTEQGSRVAVANPANVRSCNNVREVTVSVPHKIWFYKRNPTKVATELTTLARNDAINFSGDTIVPTSKIEDGRQSFNVYRCSKR
jgi:hypothetical protein